jgi:twin arginine-targeting protein translocase, TatA/E family
MIGSLEIALVLIIALVLFGPNKLPELARSVGSALGEFKMAQKSAEFDLSGFDQLNQENAEKKIQEEEVLNEKIIQTAKEAGIETEGKTTDELLALISAKIMASSNANSNETEA